MKTLHLSMILMTVIGIFVIAGHGIGIAHGESAPTHYFDVWAGSKYEHIGFPVTIQGNICPTPVPDVGTNSSIKVYASYWTASYLDNVVTTYMLGENKTLLSCNISSNIATLQTNSTDSYVFNAVAQWTEKGKKITVQGSSAPIRIMDNCIDSWNNVFPSSYLHAGAMASFKFDAISFFDCKGHSSVIFTAYNYTGNVKSNIIYQESKLVTTNDTLFNFTLPQWTDSNGLFHFLVEVNGSSGYTFDSEPFTSSNATKVVKSNNVTMSTNPSSQVQIVPEFPFVIAILLLSIASLLVFYRKTIRKRILS